MYNLLKLNLARNSLRYIIRTYDIKKLHIPYYLCKVVRESVIKEHCRPVFYHINDDFLPIKNFNENDFILYPNYFGICDKNVDILAEKYKYLIVDNSHSFYSEPKGFACFNSARKFLPVYNGSYLWIKNIGENLQKEKFPISIDNNLSLNEKFEIEFSKCDVLSMSDCVENTISKFSNYNHRLEVFKSLHDKYSGRNLLNIDINSFYSPFVYPLLMKNESEANTLAHEFKAKNILIYRYWDALPQKFNEYKFFLKLIPIPLIKEVLS